MLDRSHPEAYWVTVYLLRRVGHLALREVVGRVGGTAARISQIHTKMEQGSISKQAFAVLSHYKLKP